MKMYPDEAFYGACTSYGFLRFDCFHRCHIGNIWHDVFFCVARIVINWMVCVSVSSDMLLTHTKCHATKENVISYITNVTSMNSLVYAMKPSLSSNNSMYG